MTKFKKRVSSDREKFPFGGVFTADEMHLCEKLKVELSHKELYLRLITEKLNATEVSEWFEWQGTSYRRDDFSLVGEVVTGYGGRWCIKTVFCGNSFKIKLCLQSQITYEDAVELADEFRNEVIGK